MPNQNQTNAQRKQVMVLKQLLADSLGAMAYDYWSTLLNYFSNKITKQQLDGLLLYLTPEQQKLHNKLLMNIVTNTLSNQAGEVEEEELTFKTTRTNKHFKKRFNTRIIQSLSQAHKNQITLCSNEKDEEEVPPSIEDPKWIEGIPASCVEEGDLPSIEALYARVNFISAFQSLDPTTPEVVDLINQGLEVKLY
jgi:hypothetical protein